MPKITVCVPVYNSAQFLRQCLDSIQKQSLTDLEIICVDDQSTDDSYAILQEYQAKDPRFIVLQNPVNLGVGAGRNKAIAMAKGEFISFIDSDDFIDLDMYKDLYDKAKATGAEIAICDVDLYIDGGRKDKRKWFTPIEGQATPETLYKNTQPTNKIASLDLIRRLKFGFLEGNSDGVYVDLMVAAKRITSVDKPMYHYRIRTNSLSSEFRVKNILESVASTRLLLSHANKFQDYYAFKLIEALLQLLMVSVMEGNQKVYQEARQELKSLHFKKNPYLYSLLKKEHKAPIFWAMIHVLPVNYQVSRFLIKRTYGRS